MGDGMAGMNFFAIVIIIAIIVIYIIDKRKRNKDK
jgi:hypothetical protein